MTVSRIILVTLMTLHWIQSYSQVSYTREQREYIAVKITEGKACSERETVKDSIISVNSIEVSSLKKQVTLLNSELNVKDSMIALRDGYMDSFNSEMSRMQVKCNRKIVKYRIFSISLLVITVTSLLF